MVRQRDVLGVEIGSKLADHVLIARRLEIGLDHVPRIGVRVRAGQPELLRRPVAEQPVPARRGLELELLIMGEFALKASLRRSKLSMSCLRCAPTKSCPRCKLR